MKEYFVLYCKGCLSKDCKDICFGLVFKQRTFSAFSKRLRRELVTRERKRRLNKSTQGLEPKWGHIHVVSTASGYPVRVIYLTPSLVSNWIYNHKFTSVIIFFIRLQTSTNDKRTKGVKTSKSYASPMFNSTVLGKPHKKALRSTTVLIKTLRT